MIIYITTNLVNNNKYIGKDKYNNPEYIGSGTLFKRAIKKYGKHCFKKEILAYANSIKELNELEKYYIKLYNAQTDKTFYNIAPGGDGGKIAENYLYRERKVYELDKNTLKIIGEYNSQKEAALINNLDYRTLNVICNGKRKYVKGRLFVLQELYDPNKIVIPYRQKYIHLSFKTGIFYLSLKELYEMEFSYFRTFKSFKMFSFKRKEEFKKQFVTERI